MDYSDYLFFIKISGALGTLGDLNELNDVGSGTTINYEDLNLDNAVQVCLKNYLNKSGTWSKISGSRGFQTWKKPDPEMGQTRLKLCMFRFGLGHFRVFPNLHKT